MKIAITATESSLDGPVDGRFGRARYFLVVDTDGGTTDVVDNLANVDAAHGAGIAATESLIRRGVTAVLTGRVGPKAEEALHAAGISIHTVVGGSCREALDAHLAKSPTEPPRGGGSAGSTG